MVERNCPGLPIPVADRAAIAAYIGYSFGPREAEMLIKATLSRHYGHPEEHTALFQEITDQVRRGEEPDGKMIIAARMGLLGASLEMAIHFLESIGVVDINATQMTKLRSILSACLGRIGEHRTRI